MFIVIPPRVQWGLVRRSPRYGVMSPVNSGIEFLWAVALSFSVPA